MLIKKCSINHIFLIVIIFLNYSFIFSQKITFQKQEFPTEIKTINCLRIENKKTLWIGSGNGLFKIENGKTQKIETISTKKLQINVIEIDKDHNKWLGSYSGQLIKFKNNKILTVVDFTEYLKPDNRIITSIAIDTYSDNKTNKILLSTSDGQVFYYDILKNEKGIFKSPVKNMIYALSYGYKNKIWLCSSDGFFTKKDNGKWKQKNNLLIAYGIFKSNGKYWALGRDQNKYAVLMLYYKPEGSSEQKYVWKKFQLKKLTNKYMRFYELGFTLDSFAWITSENGLIRYNPLNGSTKIYNHKKNKYFALKSVRHIAVQNNNTIWLSSSGKDLYKLIIKY